MRLSIASYSAPHRSPGRALIKRDRFAFDSDSKFGPQLLQVWLDRCGFHFVIEFHQYRHLDGPICNLDRAG